MFRPVWSDPAPDQVRRITFVPFLRDGQCVLIEGPGGPGLPAGDVLDGEDYLIDTVMRVPLQTAGFRYQHFRPSGLDGDHLYAWIEGAPYSGGRAHGQAQLTACAPEQAAERLRACGQQALSAAVTAAAASYRNLDDLAFYADNLRTLQRSYLRGSTAQEGSGFGGDAEEWRQARQHISEGMGQSGTFLDVGCANGLLMESVAGWCAGLDLRVEPYGIDIAPGLVELARRRLPQWAARPRLNRPPVSCAASASPAPATAAAASVPAGRPSRPPGSTPGRDQDAALADRWLPVPTGAHRPCGTRGWTGRARASDRRRARARLRPGWSRAARGDSLR